MVSRLTKTVMFSTLFYGSPVWMNDNNMRDIEKLWCRISKTAIGAIFNVNQSIVEAILGIPPLQIQNHIITLKHYLKSFTADRRSDPYPDFLLHECSSSNPSVVIDIKAAYRFLEWKLQHQPELFTETDMQRV